METMVAVGLVILGVLGFVAWLGGGRKWAFRTLLSTLILIGVGAAGVLLYIYGTDKTAAHRVQKVHECALAKVADPKLRRSPKEW